ncbi:MAG: beta-propeller domain-containing protein [Acholeplasmataceae bacterium]|jgi:uncharacterized secreted protein with C-terminal beta-propeller domain|nr:beta-propeller domain-containing protein [Acholeplasmataceae bacterium]
MTVLGWIVFSLFSVSAAYFVYQLAKDIIWNRKLKVFQKSVGESVVKRPVMFWIKRSYGAAVASLFMFATVFSGSFSIPNMLGDRVLLHAKSLSSAQELRELLSSQSNGYLNWWFRDFVTFTDAVPEANMGAEDQVDASQELERDFIGTNNQVEGVEEADIIKTDGDMIYYAARYQNVIRILSIGDGGVATLEADLELGDVYTDSIFLTDEYLVVIGYSYEMTPYAYDVEYDYVGWAYTAYTGTVIVYDRETLEIAYQLETDSNFYQYRLINDALFLVSNKQTNQEEVRPMLKETEGELDEVTSYVDYDDIYYFDNVPIYGMTVFTGIDLNTFDVNSQAFLGYVNQIYADDDSLYTAFSYTEYFQYTEAQIGWVEKTQIMKFDIDTTNATFNYVGQAVLDGYIENQYWMDEYDDHLRIVTTSWNPIQNRLYVLKQSETTDELIIVGSIENGLGKPNERVYSVDFQGTTGYVVTFEQIDPRYWIDLSDPTDPKILKATERPGFSTYLHIWNEEGTQVVGFGYSADQNGRINGMEIIASNDDLGVEDSYVLTYQDQLGIWSYSYSEASYNPKAMMISPDHGIVAFPVMSWSYQEVAPDNYQSNYVSQYLVFYIDFTQEDPDNIISEPIVIRHEASAYYFGIDRGVYISETGDQAFEMIYTLSVTGMVSYNLETKAIFQTINFELPDWAKE